MTGPAVAPWNRAGWHTVLLRLQVQLRASADRADPLDETVLCLRESAVLAAAAAERARAGVEPAGALREALAAARAAVVSASYAVTGSRQ